MPGLLCLLVALADTTGRVYSGRDHQLAVDPPRVDATVAVDGVLEEPVWAAAAVLTGFSRYAPTDGLPAENRTEVLVWYSPSAIYFGVRAWARPGSVRATLADRDRIFSDDHLLFFLGTFHDGRQALVFGVNPFGVQGDGSLAETGVATSGGFSGQRIGREAIDASPDFVYASKGRLTDYGFEIEIRIPFKSLRYQSQTRQSWDLSITRQVQSLGHEESWAPAIRSAPTFLGQGGTLEGLHGLSRGLTLDLSPVVTSKRTGSPHPATGRWDYRGGSPEFGANARWGVTPNLNLNGTVKPDFAEVESDAGQVSFDPRSALFFPERRPFFLDGLENFTTPNRLIYTRRILEPLGAVKLTGKMGRTTLGFIGAVDDRGVSATGIDHPVFNLLRIQHDIGQQSRIGVVYTDRIDGERSNRVAGVDGNLLLGGPWSLQLQAANSWTDPGGGARTISAPLWQSTLSRSGRTWAARLNVRGVHQRFQAQSGFISRTGIATARLSNQGTVYGRPGSLFERGSLEVALDGTWVYDDFVHARAAQDKKLHFNQNVALRGGWTLGGSVLIESFGYDERLYRNVAVERRTGAAVDTIPYNSFVPRATGSIANLDYVTSLTTPRLHGLSATVQYIWGRDENFFEWASAGITIVDAALQFRPTEKIRVDGTWVHQRYTRRTDGSTVSVTDIPRVKVEYQITRSIFVRLVGEYRSTRQADLRDESRSGDPLLLFNPTTGVYEREGALAFHTETFRGDALLSILPSPGTVFFAGYGSTMEDPHAGGVAPGLRRVEDAFFLKMSYLFRTR